VILLYNFEGVLPAFGQIFREAFNPSAGVAGTGAGAFVLTMMWGVRRGLFSNEAGQGSAPIAHAAAKTDEPVSEGVVALLEPFIDTIVICTLTGLVIIVTSAWTATVPTEITLGGGDISWLVEGENGRLESGDAVGEIRVEGGTPVVASGGPQVAWHEVPLARLYTDPELTRPFTGTIQLEPGAAVDETRVAFTSLYGLAVESGAPMTMLAFRLGMPGNVGHLIVVLSVFLFAISTAISWSYYGDRCANYLFGPRAILPYKFMFVLAHFAGAVVPLTMAWTLGDVFLAMVIIPNLLALILLSPKVVELTRSYFERKPWIENAKAHQRALDEKRRGH